MKRRQFMRGATTAAGAVAASSFPAPAISQGLMKWRMQTTWPKNFPGLGTGANKLADYIGTASGGKLTVEVYGGGEIVPARSEEHTSELQSLMRISYAVFCLKKKNTTYTKHTHYVS